MGNARIDDAGRSFVHQPVGKILRRLVALRIKAVGKCLRAANIMKLAAEIGEIAVIGDALFEPVDFGEFNRFVKRDFSL